MKILWIPHTGWHIPQRAHTFCRPLAERHEVHVTDWIADFSSLRDYFSQRYLRNFTYRRYMDGLITVHGIPRISPALFFSSLRRLNTAIFSRYVQNIINLYRIDVVVGTFVVPPPEAPRLIFDLFDENISGWEIKSQAYAREIESVENSYIRSADAIVASSSVLYEKADACNPQCSIHHIPNGVDFNLVQLADGKRVRAQLNIPGRLVGTIGSLDNSIELNKLLKVAKIFQKEQVTFLIAGRGSALQKAQKQVKQEGLSNVVFYGYVPPENAYSVASALDVAICPYSKTRMDDARCPMKLLMFSAVGLPTVCTDLEEVRRMNFQNVVLVEEDPVSLTRGIRQALNMPRVRPPQIMRYDLKHLVNQYEALFSGEIPE